MNKTVTPLLDAVRRRLRLAWAVATLQVVAPMVAVAALAFVVAGRMFDLPYSDVAALWMVAGVVVLIGGYAMFCKVPEMLVARAADRGLATRDAFATSLELGDGSDDDFAQRVQVRAAELAAVSTPKAAVPLRWRRRPTGIAMLVAPAAIALAFMANPQDALRQDRARDESAIEATADVLRSEAERIAQQPEGTEAAERLEQLAAELEKTNSLEKAQELLDQAAAELREQVGDDLLAKKAATEGLQRSLENSPLPGTSKEEAGEQTVQEQLDALAAELPNLSDAERADAAERLEDLAATQEAGDPATADALREAAQSLREGNVSGAQARLGEAGQANAQASSDAAQQTAASDAAQAAANAGEQLGNAGEGQSAGQGQGQGQGQGSGSGSGQGQGQGSGSGSGQGQGSGGAGGNPSGPVGGGSGSSGDGGQGGQGSGTGHTDGSGGPDLDTIYDPAHGSGGETGTVGGGTGSGDGGTVGTTNGQTNSGSSQVPVRDVLDSYSRQATDAMNNPSVPPAIRALVLAYFNQLQGAK
ncbi:MAG: hypothetical protein ABL953_01885 [Ilumatobacteraceae bacterium]